MTLNDVPAGVRGERPQWMHPAAVPPDLIAFGPFAVESPRTGFQVGVFARLLLFEPDPARLIFQTSSREFSLALREIGRDGDRVVGLTAAGERIVLRPLAETDRSQIMDLVPEDVPLAEAAARSFGFYQ